MNELDELKQKWAEHDRKLEADIGLPSQLLAFGKFGIVRSALWRLAFWLGLEALAGLAVVLWLGSFIGDHYRQPRFLLPAIVLDLFQIATLIALAQQIRLALDVDYSQPVAALQKQLGTLRLFTVRTIQWTLLLVPLLWTPLLIVGLKALVGVDAYKVVGGAYLLTCLLGGAAVIPLLMWLSSRLAGRMQRSPFMQGVMRSLAGHNLNAATEFLATVTEFQQGA